MTASQLTGGINRRSFLSFLAVGAAVAGVPSLLTACTTGGGGPAAAPGTVTAGNLPTYVPLEYAKPDFPSVNGSTPGYITMPEELVTAFSAPPGSGGTYTAMTPLWTTIPSTEGNAYFDTVNEALGTTVRFQISDGNTYGDKLAAVLASAKDLPDWVCVPSWNVPPRFPQAVEALFQDLTPFLAGDKVKKYKNLANIPTDAWRICTFNDKLYGLPMPGGGVGNGIFYRADIFAELGIEAAPTTATELLELAKEVTDPSKKRWGANDMWLAANIMFGVTPTDRWKQDDAGKLINRIETEEYRAALEWHTELYASGAVHPDAVADRPEASKPNFEAGNALIAADGMGAWPEALDRARGVNPDFDMRPFPVFAADGGDPVLWKGSPANIFSFIKKNDDTAKVEELLAVADFLAAPFGTTEYNLINFGVEGTHYELDENGLPAPSDRAAREVAGTYVFLVQPPVVNAKVQYPDYVEAFCTWQADAAQYQQEDLFYGMQISEPAQFAALKAPFEALEKDIARGRKSMADLDDAVATWKSSGGDELRAFYQEILDNK